MGFSTISQDVTVASTMHFDAKFLASSLALLSRSVAPVYTPSDIPASPPPPYDIPRSRSSPPRTPTVIASSAFVQGADYTTSGADLSLEVANNAFRPSSSSTISTVSLRDALGDLESKMELLKSQREELKSQLELAVRSQSPIQELPCEILSSIFSLGTIGTDDQDPILVSTLMLVCRHWTDVSINTPMLWSNIAISTHDSLGKARRRLERSKSVSIDISIVFSPRQETDGHVTENVIAAVDLIRPALWRARSFQLSVPSQSHAQVALLRCQKAAPLLEVLSVRVCHSLQEDEYFPPSSALFNGRTPRLRSCSFTSFNFGWNAKLAYQLRVLKIGGYWNESSPSVAILLDILAHCPELEELALRNLSDADPEACGLDQVQVFTKAVCLPRLTKASFYYAGAMRTRMLLQHITFPGLQTLELCYLDDLAPILERLNQQSLISLPLHHLRIESSFFNDVDLVGLLTRLPYLVSLEFIDCDDVSSQFLKSLAISSDISSWACPKLEVLGLDGCTNFTWDSLQNFVESHSQSHTSLYSRSLRKLSNDGTSRTRSTGQLVRSQDLPVLSGIPKSFPSPRQLRSLDLTRCHQISREMVQWLKIHVNNVKCEPPQSVWGEPALP